MRRAAAAGALFFALFMGACTATPATGENTMNQQATPQKTALVVGATGAVGRELAQQLCAHPAYEKVMAWTRRPLDVQCDKLQTQQIDFERIAELPAAPVDEVFCALGSTIKQAGSQEAFWRVDVDYPVALAQWAKKAGAGTFVLVSAPGANAASSNFYLRAKGAAQDGVRAVGFARLLIVHPPLIDAERAQRRAGERAAIFVLRLLPRFVLPRYQPMTPAEIAAATLRATQDAAAGERIIEPRLFMKN